MLGCCHDARLPSPPRYGSDSAGTVTDLRVVAKARVEANVSVASVHHVRGGMASWQARRQAEEDAVRTAQNVRMFPGSFPIRRLRGDSDLQPHCELVENEDLSAACGFSRALDTRCMPCVGHTACHPRPPGM